jgi:hypothetical protein
VSAISDAVAALREALRLTDDVKRAGETLKDVARELRDHDRRLTRLEAQWDTAVLFAQQRAASGTGPGRLPPAEPGPR